MELQKLQAQEAAELALLACGGLLPVAHVMQMPRSCLWWQRLPQVMPEAWQQLLTSPMLKERPMPTRHCLLTEQVLLCRQ